MDIHPPDEMITPPLHGGETNTAPHDTAMIVMTHPGTETEITETETVKNDIAVVRNHCRPTIEALIVAVVEIMARPVVAITDTPAVEETMVLAEVMAMIILHGTGNLVMITREAAQTDLMDHVEGDMVVGLEEEIENEAHPPNQLEGQRQIYLALYQLTFENED